MTTNGMVIDFHTHIGKWSDSIARTVSQVVTRDAMKESGIDKYVATGTDLERGCVRTIETDDENIFPFHFARPDIDSGDWQRFERNLYRGAVDGLKIHPSITKMRVTDILYESYFRTCSEFGIPVIVHCGAWTEISGFGLALQVAKRWNTPIVLAHMGGKLRNLQFECLDALESVGDNVYMDTSSCFAPWIAEKAVEILGDDHILFGSDFPFYPPSLCKRVIEETNLPKASKDRILGGNAAKLLHL